MAVDVIEIFQAGTERTLALQTATGTPTAVVSTNSVPAWTNDASALTWREYGTGGVAEVRTYQAPGMFSEVTTNEQWIGRTWSVDRPDIFIDKFSSAGAYWRIAAPYFDEGTNRWIWGPFEWLDMTNSALGAGTYDGRYTFVTNLYGTYPLNPLGDAADRYHYTGRLDLYSNATSGRVIADTGPNLGVPWISDAVFTHAYIPGSWYLFNSMAVFELLGQFSIYLRDGDHPKLWDEWWWYQAGAGDYGESTCGPAITNLLRDAPVYERKWQGHETYMGISGGYAIFDQPFALTRVASLRALADTMRATRECTPYYLDDTQASGGTFYGSNDFPMLTATGLWVELDIGYTNSGGAVRFSTEGSGGTVTNYLMTTNAFAEPYKVLYRLNWTAPAVAISDWTANSTYNDYQWTGVSNTWAGAKIIAAAAIPTTNSINDARPLLYTSGTFDSGSGDYTAYGRSRRAMLVVPVGLSTNVAHDVQFYTRSQAQGDFDEFLQGASNGMFRLFDTDAGAGATAQSGWMGTTLRGDWCEEPSNGFDRARGFYVDDEQVVIKWDFQYATTVIP